MAYMVFQWGKFKLHVTKPYPLSFGHMAYEILMSMRMGKNERAFVYFLPHPKMANHALLDLRSDEVKVLAQRTWLTLLLKVLWKRRELWSSFSCAVRDWRFRTYTSWRRKIQRWTAPYCKDKSHPKWFRKPLRGRVRRFARRTDEIAARFARRTDEIVARDKEESKKRIFQHAEYPYVRPLSPYLRRLLIRDPVQVDLVKRRRKQAEELAKRLGVDPDSRIVTLHVRESGYEAAITRGQPKRAVRNARVENFFKTIDYLVGLGYTIVRLGDPAMTPLEREGVLDLARSTLRQPFLDVYFLLRSKFLIAAESGPAAVSYLTNTPCLVVNATDPVISYPIRKDGLYVLKKVIDRKSGSMLSLVDMVSENYIFNLRNVDLFEYVENEPDEILEATHEMIDTLENGPRETAAQREYKELLWRAANDLKDRWRYIGKWGPDQGFLGDGRIVRFFAERYLHCSEASSKGSLK